MSKKTHNCYDCKYRREVVGSAHSACAYLEEKTSDKGNAKLFGILLAFGETKVRGIDLHPQGVAGGWASWPIKFDPVWVTRCDYYDQEK